MVQLPLPETNFLKRSFLIRVQWLGTNCQIKHVGKKILLALNLRYPKI